MRGGRQEVEEEREEVLDGGVFTQQRREAADLVRKRRANMLRDVLAQVADARHDAGKDHLLLEELGEA